MENGFDVKLADKLSELELSDPPNSSGDSDSFYMVTKAVEAAEATIKQQVEENNRLQIELHAKMKLLEKYNSHEMAGLSRRVDEWSENVHGTYEIHPVTASVGNPENGIKSMSRSSLVDQRRTVVIHKDINLRHGDTARQTSTEGLPESSDINGTLKGIASGQIPADNSGLAQLSSPSTSSFFPSRYQRKAEYDQQYNELGHGLMPMDEANNSNNVQKQDLINKIREHEQVILQLRRYLAEYSFKEANICNEKLVLEKRIGYMRLAFDQQQQDIVDASSKALSYRQDIMEENIRLSYQLQAAQHERFTFASSLLPLLAEYSLQPPVPDVQSIVSNVKVLFKHLSEQLNITESKIKESRFQLAPWHSEVNPLASAFQSPAHLIGAGLATPNKSGLELVPSTRIPGRIQSPSDDQMGVGLDGLAQHRADYLPKTSAPDDSGRYFSHASRNTISQTVPEKSDSHGGPYARRHSEETTKQVKFREPVSTSEMDDPDVDALQNERVSSSNWPSSSPFDRPLDDPHSSYPQYLPGLEERSSSSISEGPDDDPLPGIDGLQISGDAFPGRELQACGYSINGTTSCNFEWVRHLEDGSVNYIEGAKQPNYLVTADDVGNYLAIEVQPLDNRKRKGELVKVFANEHSKIICDPEMQSYIEKTLYSGHASYKVSLSTGYLDIWEPATLVVKREGYTIKFHTSNGGVITEKFSRSTSVAIPYGHATVFSLLGSNNDEHILRVENAPEDVSCSRDTIVLTLRLFIMRAGQKPKGKKKGLFFNK